MIKVGILTFNFALNYGSLLQAYALQKVLEDMGYDAYMIDLEEINEENTLSIKTKIRKKIIKIVSHVGIVPVIRERNIKVRKFQDFRKNYNFTEKCNDLAGLQKIADEMNVIIVGSDQVWNTTLQDFTHLFMLPVKNVKKVGYSVSLGNAPESDLQKYKYDIKDFDAVSVREEKSRQLVEKIYEKKIGVTVDPTLLIGAEKWKQMAEKSSINIEGPYLLCFLFGKNREYFNEKYKLVDSIAKNKRLKVIYLNHGYNKYSFNKNALCDSGIEDFLKLFSEASAVVTDSFHGTVFSVIYERDFYSIVDSNNADRRKQDLLISLGLQSRIIDISAEKQDLSYETIDYENVNNRLECLCKESLDFLNKEIG